MVLEQKLNTAVANVIAMLGGSAQEPSLGDLVIEVTQERTEHEIKINRGNKYD